jgi:hypothetical protein
MAYCACNHKGIGMSNAYLTRITTEMLPSDVPTSIGVDFDSDGNPPGTVTPSSHKFYIAGSTGIVTEAGDTDVANDTAYVLFANGATTTSDGAGQTQTALQLTTDEDDGFIFNILASAYDDANDLAFGARLAFIGKNVGGTASIITELEDISGGDGALDACEVDTTTAGALINIVVTGIAGRTLRWKVITPGIGTTGPIP